MVDSEVVELDADGCDDTFGFSLALRTITELNVGMDLHDANEEVGIHDNTLAHRHLDRKDDEDRERDEKNVGDQIDGSKDDPEADSIVAVID